MWLINVDLSGSWLQNIAYRYHLKHLRRRTKRMWKNKTGSTSFEQKIKMDDLKRSILDSGLTFHVEESRSVGKLEWDFGLKKTYFETTPLSRHKCFSLIPMSRNYKTESVSINELHSLWKWEILETMGEKV